MNLFGKITALSLTGVCSISGVLIPVTGVLISGNSVAIAANRPTTMSTNGMVTTPHYLASQAALEILVEMQLRYFNYQRLCRTYSKLG